MTYNIISTGSQGNCLILNDFLAIDCGVSFKAIRPYAKDLQIICLSHVHLDHANMSTIKTLSDTKPSIRFAVPPWLSHIPAKNVDVLALDTWYDYGICKISPFELFHDVPQIGWRIEISNEKIIYATDTSRIDHISAVDYDYYFIENNHGEDEIKARIAEKEAKGEFVYEYRAMQFHLSKEKCDKWLMENAGDNSIIEYMHRHKEEV